MLKTTNLRVMWLLAQGVFLPLVLWLDDLRVSGEVLGAVGVFVLLEGLYLIDSLLFLAIFGDKDSQGGKKG